MLRSLYSGVSGLDVNQKSMDVIGNNIANVNTIGFKEGRAVFQDLISQTLVGGKNPTDARGGINPRQVGSGAYLAAVDNIFEPGVLKATSRTGDLAVAGNGLFVVRGEGSQNNYYTRAGDFNFDRNGSLTTPSGYRVQGWMADPNTGNLSNNGVMQDIILGPEYQVMKPRASTSINMGGILNNAATGSRLTYPGFLTQANGNQNIFDLKTSSGADLGLTQGALVDIMAHATMNTDMNSLFNVAGSPLAIGNGNSINITMANNTPYSLTYSTENGDALGDGRFTTVEQFMQEFNNIMLIEAGRQTPPSTVPLAVMSISDGQISVKANAEVNFTMKGTAVGDYLGASITGAFPADTTKKSDILNFKSSVRAGENFRDLSGLSIAVGSAMTGQVVNGGFSSTLMENNFGLRNGEVVNMQVQVWDNVGTGTLRTVTLPPLTFTNIQSNAPGTGAFNTLSEFMRELTTQINALGPTATDAAGLFTLDPAREPTVTYGITGDTFSMRQISGDMNMFTTSLGVGPTGATPNPFFKSVLDAAFTTTNAAGTITGAPLNNTQRTIEGGPVNGKGRISYSYQPSANSNIVDVSDPAITNFGGMQTGEEIRINFGPGVTAVMTVGAGGPPNFDSQPSFIAALENILGLTAGAITADPATGTLSINNPAAGAGGVDINITRIVSTSTTPFLAQLLGSGLVGQTIAAGSTLTIPGRLPKVPAITGMSVKEAAKSGTTPFSSNMFVSAGNTIRIGGSTTSKVFLNNANENTRLVDLFNNSGSPFGFVENDTSLDLSGALAGVAISRPNQLTVKVDTTITDLMTLMENFLGLGADQNSFKNVFMENGKIVVVGEPGSNNNIDFLNIAAPGSKYNVFNNYFTPEKKDATGGTSATSITLYDEQGNAHTVSMLFSTWNKERNEWRLQVSTAEEFATVGIDGASSNELIMRFNTDGTYAFAYDRLTDPITLLPNPALNFFAPNGTSALNKVSLSLGASGSADGMVISNAANSFSSTATDGYTIGNLQQQLFNPAGEIIGQYSNGQVRTLGQLGLALFRNQQGLLKVGDTMFQETANSGQATIGAAQSGSRGDINSGMLENSNVDLSREFVNMIVTQRGFQANSRVITTSDEMIQELLNLKR